MHYPLASLSSPATDSGEVQSMGNGDGLRLPGAAPEFLNALERQAARDTLFSLIERLPENLELTLTAVPPRYSPGLALLHFMSAGLDIDAEVAALEAKYGAIRNPEFGMFESKAAAECILDFVRTKRFVQSIRSHLEDLLDQRQGQIVHVVDAGCGPYPILGIAAALHSPRVKVTAIEANHFSAEIAKKVVAAFGLEEQVTIRHSNALQIKITTPIDLLVSETLTTCFVSEDFCRIVGQLSNLLAPDGRCVPERIEIERGYLKSGPDAHFCTYRPVPEFFPICQFHDVDFQPCFVWDCNHPTIQQVRIPISFGPGEPAKDSPREVWVQCRISLYSARNGKEPIVLNPEESILTRPLKLQGLDWAWRQVFDRYGDPNIFEAPIDAFYVYPPGHVSQIEVFLPEEVERRFRAAFE